jgi:hypothetical protein
LRDADYRVTSPETVSYNCFAWALHVSDEWVEPDEPNPLRIFTDAGFVELGDGAVEPGWDAVALYADTEGITHAARRLDDGRWTSKLGSWEDIEHESPDDLAGGLYGEVLVLLFRPR